MRTIARLMIVGAFVFACGQSGYAQMPMTPPAVPAVPAVPAMPAVPTVPAVPKSPAMSAGDMGKKAKSKECSAKASAQGLHGKARKEFREKCKHS